MVQEPFSALGKIRPILRSTAEIEMAPHEPSPTAPHPQNGFANVEQEIASACKQARRDRASVTLVVVSKTFSADAIVPVISSGQRVFGENRVQEAKAKWPAIKARHPDVALHLVGPLQSNKAKEAVALFDAIH